jgi:hypothetical protein
VKGWVRGLVVGAALLSVVGAVVLLVVMAADYGGKALPTGSRTSVMVDAGSDDPGTVGGSERSWFDATTARALSSELAAGLEGSDWCAGWSIVQVDGSRFGREMSDVGSNLGIDRSTRECSQWVEVEVAYEFTSPSSPLEDNAELTVTASDQRIANSFAQHPAYDISSTDLLHEDQGHNTDDILANAVAGLPLVLAEAGEIDPLTVAPVEGAAPDTGNDDGGSADDDGTVAFADAEGEGGSDLWRGNRTAMVLGLATAGLGLAVLLWAWARLPVHRAGLAALVRPGGLAAQGRAVNPRRHLKAGLARGGTTEVNKEDESAAG